MKRSDFKDVVRASSTVQLFTYIIHVSVKVKQGLGEVTAIVCILERNDRLVYHSVFN